MNLNLEINITQLASLTAIISTTVFFMACHFLTSSKTFKNSVTEYYGKKKSKVYVVILQRVSGLFFYGILPLLFTILVFPGKTHEYGLNLFNLNTSLMWIGILSPILVLINFLNAKKSDNLKMYPQIRKKKWTKSLITISSLSWITYLISYEFMFRGFLLFSCLYAYNMGTAIAINVCLYALVHLPKGLKETAGAVPFGLILCLLTIKTNSILIPMVLHMVMALSNEWFSIRAHQKMRVV